MINESINKMIKQVIETIIPWIKEGEDGQLRFVDPVDGEEISAHYGTTHAAVALIVYGEKVANETISNIGYKLLDSFLNRWKYSMKLAGFHNDFNNFALCVVWDYFEKNHKEEKFAEKIKEIILSTPDSNNPTVNWFPMRWYVNAFRYRWTDEIRYKAVCDKCKEGIKKATYEDGFIDDRLPLGLSFNLQYDVATVAVMQFLKGIGVELDLSKELGALLNVVLPDGDINYLGRGTNQIFAWGLWVYLLASAGKNSELEVALEYLKDKVPIMLKNNNMMLNEWPGEEKYMWWDYHYCSVYTAHFLFWLIMADKNMNQFPICEKIVDSCDSGIKIYRDDNYFVVTFAGRKEYLAEKGPGVVALWTKSNGILLKGTFGPWQGAFGKRHLSSETIIRNYCGLFSVKQNLDLFKYRFLHRILKNIRFSASEKVEPMFEQVDIRPQEYAIGLKWRINNKGTQIVSFPCISDCNIKGIVDGKSVQVTKIGMIRNQYTWVNLYQTKMIRNGSIWEIWINY